MKKPALALSVLLLAIAAYFFFSRPSSPTKPGENLSTTSSEPAETTAQGNGADSRPKWSKPTHAGTDETTKTNDHQPVVHGPSEFSKGELQNIVINGGIRLGDNASFVPRFNPKYRLFGNYISPEQEFKTSFDSASINYQVAGLNNNEVIFEIRTKAIDGAWSEWREVNTQNMKEPVSFGTRALAYQYRVTLFANDAPSSPTVEAVAIEPHQNHP